MFVKVDKSILKEFNLNTFHDNIKNKKPVSISVGQYLSVTYLEVCDDEVQKRVFSGVCIKVKKRVNNTMFVLRNSFKQEIIDQSFFLNSPHILGITVTYSQKKKFPLYKLYYLNSKK